MGKIEDRVLRPERHIAWVSGVSTACFIVSFFFWREVETPLLLTLQFMNLFWNAGLLIFIQWKRPRWSVQKGKWLFIFTSLLLILAIWMVNDASSVLQRPWTPF